MPKGVCVPHRGVVRLVKGANYISFEPSDVFLQFAPVSFDASTFELWGCLLNGGRLIISPSHLPTLAEIGRLLSQHQVSTLWLTAGLFHQIDHALPGLTLLRDPLRRRRGHREPDPRPADRKWSIPLC